MAGVVTPRWAIKFEHFRGYRSNFAFSSRAIHPVSGLGGIPLRRVTGDLFSSFVSRPIAGSTAMQEFHDADHGEETAVENGPRPLHIATGLKASRPASESHLRH
jgi:hypothetical protein